MRRNLGNVSRFPELAAICGAIFAKQRSFQLPNGDTLKTKLFKGTLFAVDYNGLRYVEQNPNTSSAYAAMARKGARILWVIRTHRKVKDATGAEHLVPCENEWLGRVEDGTVYMK